MSFDIVDPKVLVGEATDAHKSSGVKPTVRTITFETEAADAAGDIKALFRVGAHEIPLECRIVNDAIAGATDIDLGLYRDDNTVVDIDALMDGTDISAGVAWSAATDGLSALAIEERGILSFYEIANDVATGDVVGALPNDSYWVALTLNSEVSAAGTVTVELKTIGR
jgi:hypothetical protein